MSKIHEFDDDDEKHEVLDLSVKNNKRKNKPMKSCEISDVEDEILDENLDEECHEEEPLPAPIEPKHFQPAPSTSKKQMRFQCRFCVYKSHSVSLMQNHIYRHIDTTPYSCFYCGHKSTTKSTIMVHIELCHPNMEVKIKESRVKEEDYYLDLNSSNSYQPKIDLPKKPVKRKIEIEEDKLNSVLSFKSFNSSSPSVSSSSSLCSSPSQSPNPHKSEQLQFIKPEEELIQKDDEHESNYNSVFNRPKQYFGSLYEPDKQYSCKLCTYTTNHKPSMEDHVYVHTNTRPYRCGYCNEEIYTRYAATYHNKYKHPGEARNFIKDEQDVSIYYVNRAKKSLQQDEKIELENKQKKVKLAQETKQKSTSKTSNVEQNRVESNQPQGYDFNLAFKMYQIQLQSLMAANYLQTMRSNQPSLLTSYFGLNQEQLQQLSNYLSQKTKDEVSCEEDVVDDSLLDETENSEKLVDESFTNDNKCKNV